MSEPFIGELRLFGFNFNPRNWAKCDGQLLSIAQNTALFSLLGTTYGGDGESTFGLPDLRGRVSLHQGTGPGLPSYQMGASAGAVETTLTELNMPAHSHQADLMATDLNAMEVDPTNKAMGLAREDTYSTETPTIMMAADSIAVAESGGGQPFNNLPPYLVLNWCIALVGIFPSPN